MASDTLTAKLTDSKNSLETVRAELSSLEEQGTRADTEKVDSVKAMAEVQKESEQLLVCLNDALVGHNRAKKLTLPLMTESLNNVDAVVQQLGYHAGDRLRKGLEGAHLAVHVTYAVSLTRVFGVGAAIIRWRGEEKRYEKEVKPAEVRPAETQKGFIKASRPRRFCRGRSTLC